MTAARDLREGDVVDLLGDPYASTETAQTAAKFEYAEVQAVEWETADCVVVHTDQGSFGMPPAHDVKAGVR